jgi:hypothetical protein
MIQMAHHKQSRENAPFAGAVCLSGSKQTILVSENVKQHFT